MGSGEPLEWPSFVILRDFLIQRVKPNSTPEYNTQDDYLLGSNKGT